MADILSFNVTEGNTVARETLIACLNTGSKDTPTWSPVGIRVYESQADYDWQRETSQDIIGNTYSSMKKPIITQGFNPWELTGGDAAQQNIWNDGIRKQDAQAMANKDMLIIHRYVYMNGETSVFAERYQSCAVEINSLGGGGGGNLAMPITVTYGGTRTTGSVSAANGVFTFTPDSEGL